MVAMISLSAHLVEELGDIVDLVVYDGPHCLLCPSPYIVLLYFLQSDHLHLAGHPQRCQAVWNKKSVSATCNHQKHRRPNIASRIPAAGVNFGRIVGCTLNFGSFRYSTVALLEKSAPAAHPQGSQYLEFLKIDLISLSLSISISWYTTKKVPVVGNLD